MLYTIRVRQPGAEIRWREIVEDIRNYPRARPSGDGLKVELHTGAVIDLSHAKELRGETAVELHVRFSFDDDNDDSADSVFDVARLIGKKHSVQFWHDAFGLDYATATERELAEAFDGEAPEEGGG